MYSKIFKDNLYHLDFEVMPERETTDHQFVCCLNMLLQLV